MKQQLTQEWSDFCKQMAELNTSTFNQFAKERDLEKWFDAKDMKGMLTTQGEFCKRWNEGSQDYVQYVQKVASAWAEWMNKCTHLSDEMSKETPMNFAEQAMSSAMSSWGDAFRECNSRFTQMTSEMMKPFAAPAAKAPSAVKTAAPKAAAPAKSPSAAARPVAAARSTTTAAKTSK